MLEKDILYQNGDFWIARINGNFHVMRDTITHAQSDTAFPGDEDGYSLAKSRCDYLANRKPTT